MVDELREEWGPDSIGEDIRVWLCGARSWGSNGAPFQNRAKAKCLVLGENIDLF